jgi:hypothetical protein
MTDFDQRRTVHFGILHPAKDRKDNLPDGFISDGDSFLTWGEQHDADNTLQVLAHRFVFPTPVRSSHQRDAQQIISEMRHTLNAILVGDERLFDYAVVTDSDDWAEGQSVWTPTESDTSVVGTVWEN